MMDEYIPSPRQTPNKPRRMRDVSSVYPVDEKKLLLEAILKRQRDSSTGDSSRGRGRASDGPAGDSSPTRSRFVWREDRGCPVCRWASKSSASSGSEYDGDQSDDTSVGEDQCQRTESSSASSDSEREEEDDNKEDNSEGVETGTADVTSEADNDGGCDVEEDDDVNEDGVQSDRHRSRFFAENVGLDEDASSSFRLPKIPDRRDGVLGRDALTSPGKLLYGRHCLWYQSAGFVRPQGGK